jgi:hypothetical protein
MELPVFYRGLLFALAELRREFVAEGQVFHDAFRGMLQTAVDENLNVPAADLLQNFDPVFGISPEALEMILEGERDFMLSLLNPRLCTARFKIPTREAKQELNRLPQATVFRHLAQDLNRRLSDAP